MNSLKYLKSDKGTFHESVGRFFLFLSEERYKIIKTLNSKEKGLYDR